MEVGNTRLVSPLNREAVEKVDPQRPAVVAPVQMPLVGLRGTGEGNGRIDSKLGQPGLEGPRACSQSSLPQESQEAL